MNRKPTKQERDAILYLKPTTETCCGTCRHFEHEDVWGNGLCCGVQPRYCGEICQNYKKRKKQCGK